MTDEIMPPRTREIHSLLLRESEHDGGFFTATTDELAFRFGLSRRTLHTHLTRLRKAGLLSELESVPADGGWRRVRRVTEQPAPHNPPSQTPLPTPHVYIQEGMHTVPTGELRSPCGTVGLREACTEMTIVHEDALATLFESVRPARPFDLRLLPPFPGQEKAQPVAVPRMPRLSGDAAADAPLLVKAYKAACHLRYGRKPRVPKEARYRMGHAATALRKAQIVSPYAWAAYRLSQWQYSERRAKPPSIDYVFSRKMVEKHVEQYRRKAESYDVLHRVILTPSHRELLDRWERCRRAVASPNSGPVGEGETVRIVESILPPDVYADLAAKVPAEAATIKADLFRRMAAGEWIW